MKNKVVDTLSHLLADTYIVYVKTQNFHWNVSGPHFYAYHKMFEEHYKTLADAVDMIAERIRSLQAAAPATLSAFLALTTLKENQDTLDATSMLRALLIDHELIAKNILNALRIAQEAGDEVTFDLLIERKTEHDKLAWILRSSLGADK